MAPSSPKVVAEGGQQLLYPESKSTTNEESDTVSARTNTKVQFRGVEIREYARCLGDSPVAMGGPPLGLDWAYNIVERNSFSSILSRDRTSSESSEVDDIQDDDSVHSTVIPIEEFERMAIDKRRKRILKRMKLEEKAEKQIMSQSSRSLQRQASTGFVFFRDGSKLDPKKQKRSDRGANQPTECSVAQDPARSRKTPGKDFAGGNQSVQKRDCGSHPRTGETSPAASIYQSFSRYGSR